MTRGTGVPARTLFELAASVLLMGGVPVIIRHTSANPWTIGLVRLGVSMAVLGAWIALSRGLLRPTPRDWRALAAIGVFFGLHWATYFVAIKTAGAGLAAIGASTFGIHLIVIGWLVGHHRVRAVDGAAVGLAILGSLLVAPRWSMASRETLGLLLAVLSAAFYACLPILHQRHQHLPVRVRTFWQFTFALIVFLPFLPRAEWRLPASDWVWLGILATFCTVIAHTFWTRVTTVLSTLTTSVAFYLFVPVSLVLSVVWLGERVTAWMIGGAMLIFAGNVLGLHDQWQGRRLLYSEPATDAAPGADPAQGPPPEPL